MSKLELLAKYFEVEEDEISEGRYDFGYNGDDYQILNYEEVYEAALIDFQDHIEQLKYEIPRYLRDYFNSDKFQEDHFNDIFDWISLDYVGEIVDESNNETYYIFKY